MLLENKTVLVTGANRGIGRALVDEALARGAKRVYAAMRSPVKFDDPRVTPLTLDVTDPSQIESVAKKIAFLDVLVNNAGIAIFDDLTDLNVIKQHLDVNLFGTLNVTRAFLPQLTRSKGAIINNLTIASISPLPITPAYSISKAAALSLTQSLRALLSGQGVAVHAVILGPIDTDMARELSVPKASPESAAKGIFDGVAKGEEDIFPDPMSQSVAEGWRNGVSKTLERQFASFVPKTTTTHA